MWRRSALKLIRSLPYQDTGAALHRNPGTSLSPKSHEDAHTRGFTQVHFSRLARERGCAP